MWNAAVGYAPFAYVADTWYAMSGYKAGFTAAQVRHFYENVIADAYLGDFPIAESPNRSGSIGGHTIFYSGADHSQYHVTQDGNLLIPQYARRYYDMTGDISSFAAHATAMTTALGRVPRDATSKLVSIVLGDEYVAWGFHDSTRFTGNYLMGSLLFWKASIDLAYLFTANGDSTSAAIWTGHANDIVANIGLLWNGTEGMFHGADGQNNQVDIIGSAYAAYLGVASAAQQLAISTYLVNHYAAFCGDGLPFVYEGFWRQSNADWPYRYIIGGAPIVGPGMGDNGGWSVGNEWIAEAMLLTNPQAAVRMVLDFSVGPDMTMEWWEMWGPGQASSGFTNNLESPMGLIAFIANHPTLFQ